ncbi:hypothetical protein DFH09DRAFT_1140461 [Mycena vulgaris]|nr:hypothetical protein DFH09DRAFT_1140461 [Mycena vulgaris]
MSFFANCTNFEVSGGEFNDIQGNLNRYNTTTTFATAGSYNLDTREGGAQSGNAGLHNSRFRPAPNPTNAYHRQQHAVRSQSQSSVFAAANHTNSGWAPSGQQSSGSMRALPDPRTSHPEDDIAEQIQREARARFAQAPREPPWAYRPAPPLRNDRSRDGSAPSWSQTARPSLSVPMSRPGNSSRGSRSSGDDLLSSSPEATEAPPWPSQGPPPRGNPHRAANPSPWLAQRAPLPMPVSRSNNSQPRQRRREDDALSSSSDSEDEDMVPALRGGVSQGVRSPGA